AFPKAITGDDYSHVRIRFTFFSVIKPAAKRLDAQHRKIILGSQEREAAPHVVVATDPGDGELKGGHVVKYVSTVFAQHAVFVIGELAIIVARTLSGGEHIHHFGRANWHNWLQQHAIDQREDGRVNADR